MNETQGGVSPSGYMGSGYGFAQNRMAMSVPLPPMQQRPPTSGPVQAIGNPGAVPPAQLPPLHRAPWRSIGWPGFHLPTVTPQPLGVLNHWFGLKSNGTNGVY